MTLYFLGLAAGSLFGCYSTILAYSLLAASRGWATETRDTILRKFARELSHHLPRQVPQEHSTAPATTDSRWMPKPPKRRKLKHHNTLANCQAETLEMVVVADEKC